MRHYAHIDQDNRLLGYYNDDLHDTIPTPNVELTYDQWQSCLAIGANRISNTGVGEVFDFSTVEEKASDIRAYRNHLLSDSVDPIVCNPLRWADMSADQQNAWSQYRTDLLNITDQDGFPQSVTWPIKPE